MKIVINPNNDKTVNVTCEACGNEFEHTRLRWYVTCPKCFNLDSMARLHSTPSNINPQQISFPFRGN